MLTREDLQQIGQLIETSMERAFDLHLGAFALSVQKQFAAIEERFNRVYERFDSMDIRLDAMDTRFDQADERADAFATKTDIARLEGVMLGNIHRIERLEDDMRVVKTKLKLA